MPDVEPEAGKSLCVEKLEKSFDVRSFNCGRPSLDDWLKKYAWQSQAGNTATTYVVKNDERVVAYYSLCTGSIRIEEVVVRMAKGLPKKRAIPIIKLARLAVDEEMQGRGLGKAILKDALLRCINAAEEIAARAVIVDTLNEDVRAFYKKFGFESGPDNKNTMMILMKDLKKTYKEN